jgi:hypothetical protein
MRCFFGISRLLSAGQNIGFHRWSSSRLNSSVITIQLQNDYSNLRVHLDSTPERKLLRGAAFTPLQRGQASSNRFLQLQMEGEATSRSRPGGSVKMHPALCLMAGRASAASVVFL